MNTSTRILRSALSSENKVIKQLGRSVLKTMELLGEAEKEEKRRQKVKSTNLQNITTFLNGVDVKNKLEGVNINIKNFKTIVLSNYSMTSEDTKSLPMLISRFNMLIKGLRRYKKMGLTIKPSKLKEVIFNNIIVKRTELYINFDDLEISRDVKVNSNKTTSSPLSRSNNKDNRILRKYYSI